MTATGVKARAWKALYKWS